MKSIKRLIIYFTIIFMILEISSICIYADNKKKANFDSAGGKGPKGKGTSANNSISKDFGIRFSVIDKSTGKKIGHAVDYFKLKDNRKNKKIIHSMNGLTKIEYFKDASLDFDSYTEKYLFQSGGYAYYKPDLWNVIDNYSGRRATRNAVKKWIDDSSKMKELAKRMGLSIDDIKSTQNRLVIEPIFYFTLNYKYYGLTAHEIALLDDAKHLKGKIRGKHASRTHKNIPVSTFLRTPRFGIGKHNGIVKVFSNAEIKSKLGIGIFGEKATHKDEKPPKISTFDYTYRCDTDVYTSIDMVAGGDYTPDNPLNVTFDIPLIGTHTISDIYCPKGYTQKVWVRWHTPKDPVKMKIIVSSNNKNSSKSIITADIIQKTPWEPQNPKADDLKPSNIKDFQMNSNPDKSKIARLKENKDASWSKWEILEYQSRGDFIRWEKTPIYVKDQNGNRYIDDYIYEDIWDEDSYWSFGEHEYATDTAPDGSSVTYVVNGRSPTKPKEYRIFVGNVKISPKVAATCKFTNKNDSMIKSGYGIETKITTELLGNGCLETTGFQSAKYFFPEFNYNKYWRIGERTKQINGSNKINDIIELPKNWYSFTGYNDLASGRYHFLPIWYPDGNYKVVANVFDCWTPNGELRVKGNGDILCKGTMWEDWHIQIER